MSSRPWAGSAWVVVVNDPGPAIIWLQGSNSHRSFSFQRGSLASWSSWLVTVPISINLILCYNRCRKPFAPLRAPARSDRPVIARSFLAPNCLPTTKTSLYFRLFVFPWESIAQSRRRDQQGWRTIDSGGYWRRREWDVLQLQPNSHTVLLVIPLL